MVNENITVKNSVSFDDYLKLRYSSSNSSANSYYSNSSDETKRTIAVSCALELIRSQISSGAGYLDTHLEDISKYADTIQKALEVNNK